MNWEEYKQYLLSLSLSYGVMRDFHSTSVSRAFENIYNEMDNLADNDFDGLISYLKSKIEQDSSIQTATYKKILNDLLGT